MEGGGRSFKPRRLKTKQNAKRNKQVYITKKTKEVGGGAGNFGK